MSLEYEAIKKSFRNAALKYEENAVLQKEVLSRLIERLDDECTLDKNLSPKEVIELGCGTGWSFEKILNRFKGVQIHAIDFCSQMLDQGPKHSQVTKYLQDVHALPFNDNSQDIVFSNMLIHWCNEIDVFKESLRILKPGGLLLMSALGETSLAELKHAWLSVDNKPHVHSFPALHDMGDVLLKVGFEQVVVNAEILTLTYKEVVDLMRDIKASGGQNVEEKRSKSLMSRQQLLQLSSAYESFRIDGRLPASYEIVYLRAKKPKI